MADETNAPYKPSESDDFPLEEDLNRVVQKTRVGDVNRTLDWQQKLSRCEFS